MTHSIVCWIKSYKATTQTLDSHVYPPFEGVLKPRSFVYNAGTYPQHAAAIVSGDIELFYQVLPVP